MKIGVFTADERMIHLCDLLKKEAEIIVIDENDSINELNRTAELIDALVFPAWGIDDTGFVRMKQRGIYVLEMLSHLKNHCVIFCGQESTLLNELSQNTHYWLKDEEVVLANAELTAQGVLGHLLLHSNKAIHQMKVDLIGTGRCAKACAEYFESLNIMYRMITRKSMNQSGYLHLDSWKTTNPNDIIVNTAPACLVGQRVMENWKSRKLVIDIASGFPFVEQTCRKHPYLNLVQLKGIPAQIAPLSAAEIIANYIMKELKR